MRSPIQVTTDPFLLIKCQSPSSNTAITVQIEFLLVDAAIRIQSFPSINGEEDHVNRV
jgi:hypothetical protein